MSKNIIIDEDNNTVILSDEIKSKIRTILKVVSYDTYLNNIINSTSLNMRDYHRIVDDVVNKIENHILFVLGEKENKFNFDQELFDEVIELASNFSLKKYNYDLSAESVENLINEYMNFYKVEKKMYMLRDLIKSKDDCIINMKYFMSDDEIESFDKEYDDAIKNKDIDRMLAMLKEIQQLILNEWDIYFDNLDNMTDDNFKFIGHSTNSTDFSEEFRSRFLLLKI